MKKLTYLFLALIIVACSDDSSDSNQLFMEKYDGVVWRSDPPNDDGKITFSNDISGIIIFDEGENEDDEGACRNLIFGEPQPIYEDSDVEGVPDNEIIGYATWTIQSELEDSMVLYLEGVYTNGNPTTTGSATCTVSSGGNALQVAFVGNDDTSYNNYTIAPDEFPCN